MKKGQVIKQSSPADLEKEMALVNAYSRRELSADEVYLFSVALCDNDIDRDNERFTVEALFKMEKLFVGKTGIIDHNPSAKNQKARIISCEVEKAEGKKTVTGDELFRLTARAYIPRTAGNAELIDQIEAGIVKEVSVGCSVGRTLCSICHNELGSPLCHHVKGRVYDGEACYGELCEPTDAYEFSFVAVPAQRAAGVIKSEYKEKDMETIRTILECDEDIFLSRSDKDKIREYITSLEKQADYAQAYHAELAEKLKRKIVELGVALDYPVVKSVVEKLSADELKALIKALEKKSVAAAAPQLSAPFGLQTDTNTEFRI